MIRQITKVVSPIVLSSSLALAQPSTFAAHGISGGGAQYSPSVSPFNSQEIYCSTDMTDVFHTTNGGANWSVISWRQLTGGQLAQVSFTSSNNIRYCLNSDEMTETTIPSISKDGGVTWNEVTDPTGGNGCWALFANPQSTTQLFVSDYSNIYQSANSGTTWGSALYTDATGNGAYIAGWFFDGKNIYICTQVGLLISTNGGTSWSALTDAVAGEDIISFAATKVGSTTKFYCVTQSTGSAYPGTSGENASSYANVYTMTYPGTWTKAVTGITAGDWPMYVVTANNLNEAFLGGESSIGDPMILKTTNGGTSWKYVFTTAGNKNIQTGYCGQSGDFGWSWPGYVFGLAMSPNDSLTVVETDEGFSHKTTDGGKTWQAMYVPPAQLNAANASTPKGKYYNTTGIEMTSTWDIQWYDSLHVLGGFTDVNAVRSNDGGNTWGYDCSGLNFNTTYKFLKNPTNGVVYAATSSVHDMYQSTRLEDNPIDAATGEVLYSTDTGKTFNTMNNFGHAVIWLALDPTSSTRMYASVINHKGAGNAGGIWVSNNINLNASATWTHCTNPARTQGHPMRINVLNDGTLIATYSGRRTPAGAFTDSSGVFVSTNQGSTWTDVSVNGMKYWTMDLVVDPNDVSQNTWYCCVYSGWGGAPNGQGGLYRTTNRGTSWTKIINTTMANVGDTSSCFSVTFDPLNKNAAYLTTETGGLWYTANMSASNPVFTPVNAYPFHQPTRVFFNPYNQHEVWVTSFGNGIEMGSTLATGINDISANYGEAKVYPNPGNGLYTVVIASEAKQSQFEVYNVLGEKVQSFSVQHSEFTINLGDEPKGVYFYRITSDKGEVIATGKLVKE